MARKKRKKKLNRLSKSKSGLKIAKLRHQITDLLDNHSSRAFSAKQIMKKLRITHKGSKQVVFVILGEMLEDDKINQLRNGSYKSSREPEYIEGTVDYVNPKFGYVVTAELEDDVRIPTEHMKFALDGDRVKVRLFPQLRRGRRLGGRVVDIIERGRTEYVGRLEVNTQFAFVIPDNRKMHQDIFVPLDKINKAAVNDKVIVRIIEWPSFDKNPSGVVIEVLGPAGENDAEIHSIMAEFGLPLRFPTAVLSAAKKMKGNISAPEIKRRRDFRSITTFTIDPADAKDFDDALSFKTLANGNYEVGVHIADVTHFLNTDSVLDAEALKRATSVSLVDRTIPMLPEQLSNDLCSLNPKEDKLTYSAVFELDSNGYIRNEWFGRSIIHSDKRFSYFRYDSQRFAIFIKVKFDFCCFEVYGSPHKSFHT